MRADLLFHVVLIPILADLLVAQVLDVVVSFLREIGDVGLGRVGRDRELGRERFAISKHLGMIGEHQRSELLDCGVGRLLLRQLRFLDLAGIRG